MVYCNTHLCMSGQGIKLSVASPFPIRQASLAYWHMTAPRNAMFNGLEVQEPEQRVKLGVPMVPRVQLSAKNGWDWCLAGTQSVECPDEAEATLHWSGRDQEHCCWLQWL